MGSDGSKWSIADWIINFNPHFRMGSDFVAFLNIVSNVDFNPHFRMGSDCQ
jgi:hypothetical protein